MNTMEHIERQVADVDKKVTNILTILRGHEYDKEDKGLIGVQSDHDKRIRILEKKIDRFFWTMVGMAAPTVYGLAEFLSKIFDK